MNPATVTHIAGFPVIVEGRMIQRCAVCGEKLIDTKNEASPDGSVRGSWGINRLVRVTEGNPTHWELLNDDVLPSDSCIDLVE